MGRTRRARPRERVVTLADTTRREGKRYVRCLCGRNLYIDRASRVELSREDKFANCGKCGATVRVRRTM